MKNSYFLLGVIFLMVSCEVDTREYPDAPQIEHKETLVSLGEDKLGNKVKKVEVQFYVIDGDGDIGLAESDTIFPYVGDSSANFFPTLYYFKDNEFIADTGLNFDRFRIPDVGELGQDKTIKADIYVEMELIDFLVPYDTILYSYFIWDRAFNKSNVVYSDTIVFSEK